MFIFEKQSFTYYIFDIFFAYIAYCNKLKSLLATSLYWKLSPRTHSIRFWVNISKDVLLWFSFLYFDPLAKTWSSYIIFFDIFVFEIFSCLDFRFHSGCIGQHSSVQIALYYHCFFSFVTQRCSLTESRLWSKICAFLALESKKIYLMFFID